MKRKTSAKKDEQNQNNLATGQRAFDAFVKAVESGESDELCDLMAEDVRFLVPIPFEEWRGEQTGRTRVRELIEFERETMQLRIKFEQTAIAANGNLTAIEFRVAGSNKGGAYRNHIAIFFEIENGLVKSWREYTGDVNPKAVAAINQQT